ncbi:isochorismatase family protein [Streptomyces minutiscleroticus]|uniref:Phenazine biosynthesis protein PhzD n=1 Tax=Streptomyces minutiscleroticus TaxID=68238 RepID=A0A918U822_9ACTN|nr:isochorismatase family protein [Streptomyces minutiscleroticus]GGY05478.1 phenazine biosynthesis protein PhzD [Streptomyces minutiscleroticus]
MAGIPPIQPYPMPQAGDLPTNTAPWKPDPDRAVLLVHDMQHYFLRQFPANAAPGADLVQNATLLRNQAVAAGLPIAYTAQPGGMTDTQRGLLKDFWGPGMRVDPADRQVIEPLAPSSDDWMLTKWRYSAFFKSDLLQRMRSHGRDQIILCGVYAHIGVLATAVEAFTNDIETFLVADAVADFNHAYHQLALDYAAERCAVVTTAKSVIADLQR